MSIVVAQMSTMQNNAAQPTWTTSFPSLPSPGNTIIVVLTAWQTTQPTVATIADNQGVGNSYGLPPNGNTGITATAYIYRCKAIGATSGTFTITVTWTGGTNVYGSIRALDVSGLDTINIDDQSSATTLSTATTSHTETIGSQNSNANDLVVAAISPDTGVSSSAITDPAATGYSSIMVQQDSSTYTGGEASYKIVSALETSSASWTYASAAAYASVVATFKAAGSVTGNTILLATITPNATVNVINFNSPFNNLASISIPTETLNVFYTLSSSNNSSTLTSNIGANISYATANVGYTINLTSNTVMVNVNSVGGLFPNSSIVIPLENFSVLFH